MRVNAAGKAGFSTAVRAPLNNISTDVCVFLTSTPNEHIFLTKKLRLGAPDFVLLYDGNDLGRET
jgi:hypothetical protein